MTEWFFCCLFSGGRDSGRTAGIGIGRHGTHYGTGGKETREPCFGPQAYFDSREGIVYHLDIPETGVSLPSISIRTGGSDPLFFGHKRASDRTTAPAVSEWSDVFCCSFRMWKDNRTDMCSMDRYQLNRCSLETDRVNRSGAENRLAVRMASNAGSQEPYGRFESGDRRRE